MKKAKKVLSFLLAFAMVFAMNFTTAFAAEAPESSMAQNAVTTSGDEGIMPLVNKPLGVDIPPNSYVSISPISIPERYLAIDSSATVMGGGSTSGSYTVSVYQDGALISQDYYSIDGNTRRLDWIDLGATNNSCTFMITNNSNVGIHVEGRYYSWS